MVQSQSGYTLLVIPKILNIFRGKNPTKYCFCFQAFDKRTMVLVYWSNYFVYLTVLCAQIRVASLDAYKVKIVQFLHDSKLFTLYKHEVEGLSPWIVCVSYMFTTTQHTSYALQNPSICQRCSNMGNLLRQKL